MNNVLEKERSEREGETEAKHRYSHAAGARFQQSARCNNVDDKGRDDQERQVDAHGGVAVARDSADQTGERGAPPLWAARCSLSRPVRADLLVAIAVVSSKFRPKASAAKLRLSGADEEAFVAPRLSSKYHGAKRRENGGHKRRAIDRRAVIQYTSGH